MFRHCSIMLTENNVCRHRSFAPIRTHEKWIPLFIDLDSPGFLDPPEHMGHLSGIVDPEAISARGVQSAELINLAVKPGVTLGRLVTASLALTSKALAS